MVDAVFSYSQGELVAALTISEDNLFVRDGEFQEVGLLEHQAQCVALYTGYQYFLMDKIAPPGYIGAVKKYKIEALPKTGEQIVSYVEILGEFMGITLVKIESKIGDETIAVSEIKTVLK